MRGTALDIGEEEEAVSAIQVLHIVAVHILVATEEEVGEQLREFASADG